MRKVDKALLKRFATPGPCEVCGAFCQRREGHHIIRRSSGRLDVVINLVSVGSSQPFPECPCHAKCDSGEIPKHDLFAIVAKRESRPPEIVWTAAGVEDAVRQMMRMPKEPKPVKAKAPTMEQKITGNLLSWAMRLIDKLADMACVYPPLNPKMSEEVARWRREARRFGVKK